MNAQEDGIGQLRGAACLTLINSGIGKTCYSPVLRAAGGGRD